MSGSAATESGGWFWNFVQMRTSDVPDYKVLEVKHPYFELGAHVTFKTVQTAAFVGGVLVNPLVHAVKLRSMPEERQTKNVSNVCRAFARRFSNKIFLAGLVAGPALTALYLHFGRPTRVQLRDRCLRLRYNTKNLFVDRLTFVCGFIGWYTIRLPGAVIGVNVGLALAGFYLAKMWERARRKGSLWEDISRQPDMGRYYVDLAVEAVTFDEQPMDAAVFGCDVFGVDRRPLTDYLGGDKAEYDRVLERKKEGKPGPKLSFEVLRTL